MVSKLLIKSVAGIAVTLTLTPPALSMCWSGDADDPQCIPGAPEPREEVYHGRCVIEASFAGRAFRDRGQGISLSRELDIQIKWRTKFARTLMEPARSGILRLNKECEHAIRRAYKMKPSLTPTQVTMKAYSDCMASGESVW